ncbi:MAG: ankyrin repeat domain-containing protein [Oligoflexales bacterium]|nr:ankyrin repeat domain-containing protein [Oligoflexales bacterium]
MFLDKKDNFYPFYKSLSLTERKSRRKQVETAIPSFINACRAGQLRHLLVHDLIAQDHQEDLPLDDCLKDLFLYIISDSAKIPVLKFLLEKGANLEVLHEKTDIQLGQLNPLEYYLHSILETEKEYSFPSGKSQLMLTIIKGHFQTAQALLDYEDTNHQDFWGRSALMYAVTRGDLKTVNALIESGADINQVDGRGRDALMLAAEKGFRDITRVLLNTGSIPTRSDQNGETFLELAARNGYQQSFIELYQSGYTPPKISYETLQAGHEGSDNMDKSKDEQMSHQLGDEDIKNINQLKKRGEGGAVASTVGIATVTTALIAGTAFTFGTGLIAGGIILAIDGTFAVGMGDIGMGGFIANKRQFKKEAKIVEAAYIHLGMMPVADKNKKQSAVERFEKFYLKYIVKRWNDTRCSKDMAAAQIVLAHQNGYFSSNIKKNTQPFQRSLLYRFIAVNEEKRATDQKIVESTKKYKNYYQNTKRSLLYKNLF